MSLPPSPRVVVTGAGSGLGRAFCVELARRGARILASDISLAAAQETVGLLGGAEAHAVACDVAQLAEVEALAAAAEERLGGTDVVINNAGVAVGGLVGEVPMADWKWVIDINLWGVIHGCHVFTPRLRRQGRGHILNVASAAGLLGPPFMAPYDVTKAGVIALSEALRAELAGSGVGVTVLCPTFFATNITRASRGGDEEMRKQVQALMDRAKLSAADVARIALDGAERDALYVLPQADARLAWRLKRLLPQGFHRLMTRISRRHAPRARG